MFSFYLNAKLYYKAFLIASLVIELTWIYTRRKEQIRLQNSKGKSKQAFLWGQQFFICHGQRKILWHYSCHGFFICWITFNNVEIFQEAEKKKTKKTRSCNFFDFAQQRCSMIWILVTFYIIGLLIYRLFIFNVLKTEM